jgi:hypothetical protein
MFSQTLQRYSSVHEKFSAKIINQTQFVITTEALKCSKYCMLLSIAFVPNGLGMLVIAHQNAQTSKFYTEN